MGEMPMGTKMRAVLLFLLMTACGEESFPFSQPTKRPEGLSALPVGASVVLNVKSKGCFHRFEDTVRLQWSEDGVISHTVSASERRDLGLGPIWRPADIEDDSVDDEDLDLPLRDVIYDPAPASRKLTPDDLSRADTWISAAQVPPDADSYCTTHEEIELYYLADSYVGASYTFTDTTCRFDVFELLVTVFPDRPLFEAADEPERFE